LKAIPIVPHLRYSDGDEGELSPVYTVSCRLDDAHTDDISYIDYFFVVKILIANISCRSNWDGILLLGNDSNNPWMALQHSHMTITITRKISMERTKRKGVDATSF
jgi:hypothetical protein